MVGALLQVNTMKKIIVGSYTAEKIRQQMLLVNGGHSTATFEYEGKKVIAVIANVNVIDGIVTIRMWL
jgi:hypothetical protein